MYRCILLLAMLGFSDLAIAQIREEPIMLRTKDCDIQGALMLPDGPVRTVVLIVAGSGPIDRNGNAKFSMRTNSYRMYAMSLAVNGIASVRYDKRGMAASRIPNLDQSTLRLSMYADDVSGWVELLSRKFQRVVIAGHSEGSLLGLLAINKGCPVHGFISLEGAGRKIEAMLREQVSDSPAQLRNMANDIIDSLSVGRMVGNVHPLLRSLFTPSVQPFLMSMFLYDPAALMRKVQIPTLIIQGDTDVQIKVEDAKLLFQANRKAKLVIINGMNYVLKECYTTDAAEQLDTYLNPAYPLPNKLIDESVKFIKTI